MANSTQAPTSHAIQEPQGNAGPVQVNEEARRQKEIDDPINAKPLLSDGPDPLERALVCVNKDLSLQKSPLY